MATVVVADVYLTPLRAEFEAALPPGREVSWPAPRDAALSRLPWPMPTSW